jgi:hypothetical protein
MIAVLRGTKFTRWRQLDPLAVADMALLTANSFSKSPSISPWQASSLQTDVHYIREQPCGDCALRDYPHNLSNIMIRQVC